MWKNPMWDAPAKDDAPGDVLPGWTAALACPERLAWLLRAVPAPDILAVPADERAAAHRAVQDLNNLAGEALAEWHEHAGSAGLRLTPRGRRLCVALMTLRAEHERLAVRFGPGFEEDIRLLDRVALRTSARNQFVARIAARPQESLREDLLLELAGRRFIRAAITRESVRALGLRAGLQVVALVKASSVALRAGGGRVEGEGNRLTGRIAHVIRDAELAEVVVDLGAGLTGTALVDGAAADGFGAGQRATLVFPSCAVVIGRVA
jgi:molybdate transport system regulatory protein